MLFLAANPLDQEQLRLDEEVRAIGEMIRKSEHRDAVRLESRWAVRPLDVLQAINECRPRVVHFSGHGSGQDEIVFRTTQATPSSPSRGIPPSAAFVLDCCVRRPPPTHSAQAWTVTHTGTRKPLARPAR